MTNPAPEDPTTRTVAQDHVPHPETLRDDLPADDPKRPAVPGYDALEPVGEGGMGVVYKATQTGLNRTVALKMVRGRGPLDAREAARFLAEAEAAAAVVHPNVVRVYDLGEHAGRPYLAMEYLPGGTLADKLATGRLAPREAATFAEKIARGVAAAHAAGVVHRDLKPGNVLLDEHGEPKVADFGLAKRTGGSADLTRTQAVVGTPAYMAPEQAVGQGKTAGPAADVWAVGVILYEMLAGKRPFDAGDALSVLKQVTETDPARPRTANTSVPRDLELVCLKCLEKDPARRYPTAAELADDLRRFLDGRPVKVRAAGTGERAVRWMKRNPVVTGLLGLMVVILGLLAFSTVENYQRALETAANERHLREDAESAREQALVAKAAADAEAVRANRVSEFMGELFRSSDPLNIFGDLGENILPPNWEKLRRRTADDFLDDAAKRLPTALNDQPLARAALLLNIGVSLQNVGRFAAAEPLLREAAAVRRAKLGPNDPETAEADYKLGRLLLDTGDFEAAVDRFRSARAIYEQAGADEKVPQNVRMFETWALTMLGRPEAEGLLRQGIADRSRLYGPRAKETLILRFGLVGLLLDRGRADEAMKELPEVLACVDALPPCQFKELSRALVGFQTGVTLRGTRQAFPLGPAVALEQSKSFLSKAVADAEKVLPADHIYLGLLRYELAVTLDLMDEDAAAERLYARVLADVRATVGLAHPKALFVAESYAAVVGRAGRADDGRAVFDECERANRERFGPANGWRAILLLGRCEFEAEHGSPVKAAEAARAAVQLADAGKLPLTRQAAAAAAAAGEAAAQNGAERAAVLELFRVARKWILAVHGEDSRERAVIDVKEGVGRYRLGDRAEADRLLADAVGRAERVKLAPADVRLASYYRGRIASDDGRYADAEGLYRTAAGLSRGRPVPHAADLLGLAGALADQGKYMEAAAEYGRSVKANPPKTATDKSRATAWHAALLRAAGDKKSADEKLGPLLTEGKPSGPVVWAAGLFPDPPAGANEVLKKLTADGQASGRAVALLWVRAGQPGKASLPDPKGKLDHLAQAVIAKAKGESPAADRAAADRLPMPAGWLDRLEARVLMRELDGR